MDLELLEGHPITDAEMNEIKAEFHPGNTVNVNILFPVGAILPMSGNLAPDGFLPCDGRVVDIEDYPNLANYYEQAQGSKNFYGGDGTTTFGVPDLRGEFLRGSGTNSHSGQGSGSIVGQHQDATEIRYVQITDQSSASIQFLDSTDWADIVRNNQDSVIRVTGTQENPTYNKLIKGTYQATQDTSGRTLPASKTSRPTNTSVLYCVKY